MRCPAGLLHRHCTQASLLREAVHKVSYIRHARGVSSLARTQVQRPVLHRIRFTAFGIGVGALGLGLGYYILSDPYHNDLVYKDTDNSGDPLLQLTPHMLKTSTTHLQDVPMSDLYRAWFVQLLSSSTLLVRYGANIFECLQSIASVPIVGPPIWAIARYISKTTFWEYVRVFLYLSLC